VSENWAKKSICNLCVRLYVCVGIVERKARCRKQEAKETATHTAAAAAVSLHVCVCVCECFCDSLHVCNEKRTTKKKIKLNFATRVCVCVNN